MKNTIAFEQRYAGLQPIRFISLSVQINQLYEGPWVQLGNYPEEGTNNPNPSDQEKARRMWRSAYKKLKPYEKFIYEDYAICRQNDWGWSSDPEYKAIMAMHDLCESYHNIVELWDEIQREQTPVAKVKEFLESLQVSIEFDPVSMSPTLHMGRASEKGEGSSEQSKEVRRAIELPVYFAAELRANKRASEALVRCLEEMDPKVNAPKGNRSEKWQWPHVKSALVVLKLVDKDLSPTDFGKAINALLPHRTEASVKQSFKSGRINDDFPNMVDKSIINEMVKLLDPVKRGME